MIQQSYSKILILEDDPADIDLIAKEIKRAGIHAIIRATDKRSEFEFMLKDFLPDVIISDYNVPGFSGLDALHLAIRILPQTPFIFVTGTIGEELAAETVLGGAWGFVLKQNLHKLGESIINGLAQVAAKRVPARIRAVRETSMRIKDQIERNNKVLDKVRGFMANQQEENADDLLIELREQLEASNLDLKSLEDQIGPKKDTP